MNHIFPIVADECVDYAITHKLREAGFNVYAICEQNPALKDRDVLELAHKQNALLITEDKDFGELVIRLKLPHFGILLLRMKGESSSKKAEIVFSIISKYHNSLLQAFSVLDGERFRTRSTD